MHWNSWYIRNILKIDQIHWTLRPLSTMMSRIHLLFSFLMRLVYKCFNLDLSHGILQQILANHLIFFLGQLWLILVKIREIRCIHQVVAACAYLMKRAVAHTRS